MRRGDSIELEILTLWVLKEELATIGVGNFHTVNCVTENDIRQEQGWPLRGAYSTRNMDYRR